MTIRRVLAFFSIVSASMMIFLASCSERDGIIPIPMTEQFEQNLSSYNIYQGDWSELNPTADYQLIELNSPLYSNYAKKQRLVKLPTGTQITQTGNGIPEFPEGTILVKTFYYFKDERDKSLGRQVIETRLLIKSQGLWNVATYVWNESQTEGILDLDGHALQVSWINSAGTNRTINYEVPDEKQCVACHQTNAEVSPIGPSMRNMNITVLRDNFETNQLAHFQSLGLLNDFDLSQISNIPDYNDTSLPLADRGRAYMDMNCAHCHNPSAWDYPSGQNLDFRFETALSNTGIEGEQDRIKTLVQEGEMPYFGTTVIDEEGVSLIVEYLNSL